MVKIMGFLDRGSQGTFEFHLPCNMEQGGRDEEEVDIA